jgi:hypothetical protein
MKFNLHQRFANGIFILQARMARLLSHEITVSESTITTIILSEAKNATR